MNNQVILLVKLNGEKKMAQYAEVDNVIEFGKEILSFLKNSDLEKFKNELKNIHFKKDFSDISNDPLWKIKYPYLRKDIGIKLFDFIMNNQVNFLEDGSNFYKYVAKYIINFDNYTYELESKDKKFTYDLTNLPELKDSFKENLSLPIGSDKNTKKETPKVGKLTKSNNE